VKYILKYVYPDGNLLYGVINPGFEDLFTPNAARSPHFDRQEVTQLTREQAEQWKAVLEGGFVSYKIEIEPA
jgi:hypothetical protein